MPRRQRNEQGLIIKKDGTIDKRSSGSSKNNLKKSSLYQRVLKNKEVYESSSDESDDEYDVVELKPKSKPEPEKPEINGEGEDVPEIKEESIPVVEEKVSVPVLPEAEIKKKVKKYKVVKSDSDSSDSSDEEESKVVKYRKYTRKIKNKKDEIENLRQANKKLMNKVKYNTHLQRVNQMSRDISIRF